ncbi:hypothetical protein L228DRAFT_247329 [Xylona heveae TC161]|uniref:AB hydrolase-1 domain-containing protein n=1 Tax=Xylona heveae (strain CBS 132557 / TC161) TaxID=1328760 RepID=A0A165H2X6_XYLHT|nr:hypothetical protein L228DRAFT_247329 [Xylona heveae TC161]KZF22913.1 hypothetical protein L228DRAFT_247329 [Xylona heveae TC161]
MAQGMEEGYIALPSKPSATISYSFIPGTSLPSPRTRLVVFLNGLMLPKILWLPVTRALISKGEHDEKGYPSMLCYDRYGQGATTDKDPADRSGDGHGHDVSDAVADLHELIKCIAATKLDIAESDFGSLDLVFVCNSIGCAIARLYAQTYPNTVSGLLFLDSIMANSDFVSIWPDPDAADFDANALPKGVTVEDIRVACEKSGAMFHPSVPNSEGLSRRNLAQLLPYSDGPQLVGPRNGTPLLTVVGHDWEAFAQEGLERTRTPIALTMNYTNPYWHRYNQDLVNIVPPSQRRGPIFAKGCGHFIQRDDPLFVAEELSLLLKWMDARDI